MLKLLTVGVCFSASGVIALCWRDTVCSGPASPAFEGPWEDNSYSPVSRLISPKYILSLADGDILSEYDDGSQLTSSTPGLVYDFGFEVGGIISINYTLTGEPTTIGVSFTESKSFIGQSSDHSIAGSRLDGYLSYDVTGAGPGIYTVPDNKLRGGFRYVTIFQLGNSTLDITGITLEISFQPTWENLRAYQGYFHSSDTDLNRIWYAGAYTVQTNSIAPTTGRSKASGGWSNNVTVGTGDTILVDGAKRDRWVWPGDMGIAIPSAFASTGDLESVKSSLQTMYNGQSSSGELPMAGPPYNAKGSDTYHMWTLIGTYYYILFTHDLDWLTAIWPQYLSALNYVYSKVDSTGLLQANGTGDWGRKINAVNGSSPNMLLHRTLTTGAYLANVASNNGTELSAIYTARANNLTRAIQKYLWDSSKGAYRDSPITTDIFPQDANSMAVAFGVVEAGSTQAKAISTYLAENWTPVGPASPELPNNVSPFISSIEIAAHFRAGYPDRALELVKTCWGWYLDHPNGTQSTFVEGYLQDGSFLYRGDYGYRNDALYISHAHSWSSGPTSALTQYLVGLWVSQDAGAKWELKPTFVGVTSAQAGFTTPLGTFRANWTIVGDEAVVEWDTPVGTLGWIDPTSTSVKGTRVKGGKGSLTYAL